MQVDEFGTPDARSQRNVELEFERNGERYEFLRWGQSAFDNFRVVPPGTGICHQVNLEYLAPGASGPRRRATASVAYPDTLVGTDSHTTMVNGLGVLGWGVGGIEAEAAMLGQPVSMLIPEVVGFKLTGKLPRGRDRDRPGADRHQMLRKKGVVGKFVEFFGAGARQAAARRPRDDRQHGARVRRDLRLLPGRRRDARLPAPHRPRRRSGSRWSRPTPRRRACSATTACAEPVFTDTLELDLAHRRAVARRPEAAAGPRARCRTPKRRFEAALPSALGVPADDADAARAGRRHGRTSSATAPW